MAIQEIRLLGNPAFRSACSRVRSVMDEEARSTAADLAETLAEFKRAHGFGRGIAAPQIGVGKRIIVLDTDVRGPMFNPVIRSRSRGMFRLWDDCFSFPDIVVEVRRHRSVTVEFTDAAGEKRTLAASGALSELLQHEIDHLDGILAIDRAMDAKHIMLRSEFVKRIQPKGMTL